MSLLDSVRDFLIESLEDYQKDKLAFSVLHAVAATEVLLKERLSRIHQKYRNRMLKGVVAEFVEQTLRMLCERKSTEILEMNV